MSGFSDVDRSGTVESLVAYLRAADQGLDAMKSYMVAAMKRVTDGLVLDLGCGVGYDLARLDAAGLVPIGLDSSREMLRRCHEAAPDAPLMQGDGAALPLRTSSVLGCRIERTLQHVADPARVVAEVARVVAGGGCVTIFEPDYRAFRVESDIVPDGSFPAALLRVKHPGVGGNVAAMLTACGFRILDVVTESSRSYHVDHAPVDIPAVVRRAVSDGRCEADLAAAWLAEQRERSERGTYRAMIEKVLVVARRLEHEGDG